MKPLIRHPFCVHYSQCLTAAARLDVGFTCAGCRRYQYQPPDVSITRETDDNLYVETIAMDLFSEDDFDGILPEFKVF
jgi:hypothetical protein